MKLLASLCILLSLACASGTQTSMPTGKMIIPGKGTDELHVGMARSEIIELLGAPKDTVSGEPRLDYRAEHGLEFFLGDGGRVARVHFCAGFHGRLPSRIGIGSRMMDVFGAYGTPTQRRDVSQEEAITEDRVLYSTPEVSLISYHRLGLSFRFSPQKRVTQIAVFNPLPNRHIRTEPQKQGAPESGG